ncbi:MAG TPA: hypothetical protein VK600_00420 [Candidatus Saccharimonadales bacterium]|nr:hypothetical protein [Candidatus Saccharimonadales bacterium]
MTDASQIEKIVDASAYVASLIDGVKTVWGAGTSGITFPVNSVLLDGVVKTFTGEPVEPYTHLSDMPSGSFTAHSATWTDVTWRIPLTLFLDANDQQNARRVGFPFIPKYLAAFAAHSLLFTQYSGVVNAALLQDVSWTVEQGTWFAMRMTLEAKERLNLDYQAG